MNMDVSDDEGSRSGDEVHSEEEQDVRSPSPVQNSAPGSPHSEVGSETGHHEVEDEDEEVQHSDVEADEKESVEGSDKASSDQEVEHSDVEMQQDSGDEQEHHSARGDSDAEDGGKGDNASDDEEAAQSGSDDESAAAKDKSDEVDERAQGSGSEHEAGDSEVEHSDAEPGSGEKDEDDDEGSVKKHSQEADEEEKDDSDDERRPSSPVDSDAKEAKQDSDDDDDDDDSDGQVRKRKHSEAKSDSESDDESKVGDLIADIFGESDDEEFEGFGEEELEKAKQKKEKKKIKAIEDSDDEEAKKADVSKDDDNEDMSAENQEEGEAGDEEQQAKQQQQSLGLSDDEDDEKLHRNIPEGGVYDFDLMMQRKKEENQRRRRRKDVDIINDSDDLIAEIINQMKQAAEEDRELNKNHQAATKKLKLLPLVVSQLKKADLKMAFLDQGVLGVMAEWLSPLPDRSLPNLKIRENMLRLLGEFPSALDQSLLKSSGIGRAVMYLYKHPRETRENRDKAGRLISEWARPIFNLNADYHSMSKEEREQRDFNQMPKKRKMQLEAADGQKTDIDKVLNGEEQSLRPGDPGWIARARVPMPSTKDYVVRPKWNVETEIGRMNKKQATRLDKHVRMLQERKKMNKVQRAVTISIEGRKMSL